MTGTTTPVSGDFKASLLRKCRESAEVKQQFFEANAALLETVCRRVADALATAAFVMGPETGIPFLERMGVDGLILTPELQRFETRGLRDAA